MPEIISVVILLLVVIFILVRCIRIVQQAKAYVIEFLGAYKTTWNVGLHFKIPFVEKVAKVVTLKEQVADFPPQPVITKDNVTMQIDTVVYFQITDPKLYTYGIEQPMVAIENLSATTLRNIIGDLELDQCLTSRDIINTKMRTILDEATDPWGIKVNRVELKNILPPKEIQNAMEKQMNAVKPSCVPRAKSAPRSSKPRAKRNPLFSAPTRRSSSRSLRPRAKPRLSSRSRRPLPRASGSSTKPLLPKPSSRSRRWKPSAQRQTAKPQRSLSPAKYRAWQVLPAVLSKPSRAM